jgi:hypothetical protein
MVDVLWDGETVMLFTADLRAHGTSIKLNSRFASLYPNSAKHVEVNRVTFSVLLKPAPLMRWNVVAQIYQHRSRIHLVADLDFQTHGPDLLYSIDFSVSCQESASV